MLRASPRRHLPPLNAVRAFEAAARHGSFKAAAEELGVTHGAVSRQVHLLEEWLGGPALFRRLSRGVALTPDGDFLLNEFGPALDRMAAANRPPRCCVSMPWRRSACVGCCRASHCSARSIPASRFG